MLDLSSPSCNHLQSHNYHPKPYNNKVVFFYPALAQKAVQQEETWWPHLQEIAANVFKSLTTCKQVSCRGADKILAEKICL